MRPRLVPTSGACSTPPTRPDRTNARLLGLLLLYLLSGLVTYSAFTAQ